LKSLRTNISDFCNETQILREEEIVEGILLKRFSQLKQRNSEIADAVCENTFQNCERILNSSIMDMGHMNEWNSIKKKAQRNFDYFCKGPNKKKYQKEVHSLYAKYYSLAQQRLEDLKRKFLQGFGQVGVFVLTIVAVVSYDNEFIWLLLPVVFFIVAWLFAYYQDPFVKYLTCTEYGYAIFLTFVNMVQYWADCIYSGANFFGETVTYLAEQHLFISTISLLILLGFALI